MGAGHRVQWRSSAPSTVGELERNERVSAGDRILFMHIFAMIIWMCGVCACVNRPKSVSHDETVRDGSSAVFETTAGARSRNTCPSIFFITVLCGYYSRS